MRLSSPGPSARRAAIGFAIASLVLLAFAGGALLQRRATYLRRATTHRAIANTAYESFVRMREGVPLAGRHAELLRRLKRPGLDGGGDPKTTKTDLDLMLSYADHQASLVRKYYRAAQAPWRRIVPGPPESR